MRKILIVGNWKMHIGASAYETNLRFFSIAAQVRNEFATRAALFPNCARGGLL
jgi:triosephosphate isomerase